MTTNYFYGNKPFPDSPIYNDKIVFNHGSVTSGTHSQRQGSDKSIVATTNLGVATGILPATPRRPKKCLSKHYTLLILLMSTFSEFFKGHLQGIMNEESYVKMATSLSGNWFGVNYSEEKKNVVELAGHELHELLIGLYEEVKSRKSLSGKFPHTYVHNRENPLFIKLYDPKQCGGSCSTVAPTPWWVFSSVKPDDHEIHEVVKKKKK